MDPDLQLADEIERRCRTLDIGCGYSITTPVDCLRAYESALRRLVAERDEAIAKQCTTGCKLKQAVEECARSVFIGEFPPKGTDDG